MNKNTIGLAEAQVWAFPLRAAANLIGSYEAVLSLDESNRANRFVTDELRERFIVCRGTLRRLLAVTVDCLPQDIVFRYQQWGKPELAGANSVHFNVSHSGDWGLIALSLSPIGIDLEVPNDRIQLRAIASQVLSDVEQGYYEQLPHASRAEAILHLWVCKEALLKALGLGIAEGLKKTTFNLPIAVPGASFSPERIDPSLQLHLDDDGTCRMNSWIDAETWQVRLIDAIPGCVAALATMRQVTDVTLRELS